MAFHFRRFFYLFIKKNFPLAAIVLFLLPLFSCNLNKQVIVSPDFSVGEMPVSLIGFVDDRHIFSAIAQMELIKTDGYYPFKAALIIKRPSYLRLELLPLIGTPDFLLTVTPEKVNIFIPSKKEFYSGQPTSNRLHKFFPWPMDIEEMLMIFTGAYPSLKEGNISYRGYREDNLSRLEMTAPSGGAQTVWLGKSNKLLKLVRRDKTGQELYTAEYVYADDFSAIPDKITITMADGVTSLTVRYSDVNIEKATDLSVFDLAAPADVKTIILE